MTVLYHFKTLSFRLVGQQYFSSMPAVRFPLFVACPSGPRTSADQRSVLNCPSKDGTLLVFKVSFSDGSGENSPDE